MDIKFYALHVRLLKEWHAESKGPGDVLTNKPKD